MNRPLSYSLLAVLPALALLAEAPAVSSGVHAWAGAPIDASSGTSLRRICEGSAHDLSLFEVTGRSIPQGGKSEGSLSDELERILIVKQGTLLAKVAGQSRALGEGSVVMVMPGDSCELATTDVSAVTYYQFRYKSRQPVDLARGRSSGGSRLIEWAELPFKANSVGGRRQPFERATAMFAEAEMHVTTLNPGLTTHAPHTHKPEEIILVIRGEVEMHIAGKTHRGGAGDLFFVSSEVPHNLVNVGAGQAEYYAFQWR
jgi:(S)-ureidoglycine aminohydrolase